MDVSSLDLDLDVILYTIRSSKEYKNLKPIENEVRKAKANIKDVVPLFQVLDSYFLRNNTPNDVRNAYYQKELDSCLNNLRHHTSDIVKSHQALNYPIPDWLMSQVVLAEDSADPELQFEINLFNWINSVKNEVIDKNELEEIKSREGFNDLNLSVTPYQNLHGFLTFDVIIDKWKYRDMRMHRKIDTLINKEWGNLLKDLIVKVEFMTGKIGIIMVLSRKDFI